MYWYDIRRCFLTDPKAVVENVPVESRDTLLRILKSVHWASTELDDLLGLGEEGFGSTMNGGTDA
jgi:hypothetical protein